MNQVDRRNQWWQTICSESCVSGRLFCSNRHTDSLIQHTQTIRTRNWMKYKTCRNMMGSNYQSFYGLLFVVAVLGIRFLFVCANTRTYLKETKKLVRTFEKSKEANDRKSFIYLSQRVEFGSKLYAGFCIIIFAFKWIRRGVCASGSQIYSGLFIHSGFNCFHFVVGCCVCLFRLLFIDFAECTRRRIKCILHRRTDQTRTGSHDLGSNVEGITEPGYDIWDHKTFFQANFWNMRIT